MNVSLIPAGPDDRSRLENLFQLYVYDFSDVASGIDVEESGRFTGRSLAAYWEDSWRHAFILRVAAPPEAGGAPLRGIADVDEKLAGFALVHRQSRLSGDTNTWDMAEFFVVRKYRHRGVGSEAAHRLFALHRGKWEVRQLHANVAATAFWRHAIGAFTGGRFDEVVHDDDRWRGTVQSFVS